MYNSNRDCLEYVLKYFGIPYGKQTKNALNIDCPYCSSDEDKHCGIFYDTDYYNFTCFKCKTSGSLFDLLNHLMGISFDDYQELLKSNRPLEEKHPLQQIQDILNGSSKQKNGTVKIKWPPEGSIEIKKAATEGIVASFLKRRELNLDDCIQQDVRIGVVRRYTGRFIIPVYYEGKVVAYQARDMTNRFQPRYLTEGDVSNYLYGFDDVDNTQPVVITEGVFDAWAVGCNAISTFSASLSTQQIQLMIKLDAPLWIFCWDIASDGSDAFWKGREAAFYLSSILGSGKVAYVELPPDEDAASLGTENIHKILKDPIFV